MGAGGDCFGTAGLPDKTIRGRRNDTMRGPSNDSCGCSVDMRVFWEEEVCALLKRVDNIERYMLHRSPTSAELRKLGKETLRSGYPS